jgi:hypothetical protein
MSGERRPPQLNAKRVLELRDDDGNDALCSRVEHVGESTLVVISVFGFDQDEAEAVYTQLRAALLDFQKDQELEL